MDSEALRQEPARSHPVAKGLAVVGLVLAACSVLGAVLVARGLVREVSDPARHTDQGVGPGLLLAIYVFQLPAGGLSGLSYLLAWRLEERLEACGVAWSRLRRLLSFTSAVGIFAWGFQALVAVLYLVLASGRG